MDTPKQKPKMTKPKTLDKALRTPDKVRSVSSRTKDNMQSDNAKTYNEYATDTVTDKSKKFGRKGIELGKKGGKKGYDKAKGAVKNRTIENKKKSSSAYKTSANGTRGKATPKTKGASSVKSAGRNIKNSEKTIKTAKMAKAQIKTTKRSAKVAMKAASKSAKAVKATAKAMVEVVKAAVVSIKALLMGVASSGWILIFIIVAGIIANIIASPWALFVDDTDEDTPTVSEVVVQLKNEFSGEITSIISSSSNVDVVVTDMETSTANYEPPNLIDVLGVFGVKTAANPNKEEYVEIITMDETKVQMLRGVFWDMTSIKYEIVEEEVEPQSTTTGTSTEYTDLDASPSPSPTPEIIRTLVISIESMTFEQGAKMYGFTDEQNELLAELMSAEYYPMFMEICGLSSFNGLTPEQAAKLINDLPEGELGSVIVKFAITRLGDPYSKMKRGQGSYVDCSYLARWCYQQAGVSDYKASTAAEQARYCVNNNLTIARSDLQAGDLIFWSFKTNGRFRNISHVGIYVGDGYIIDASSGRGMVVYRELFGESSIIYCARSYVK